MTDDSDDKVAEAQAYFASLKEPGEGVVDELLADRRAEARKERREDLEDLDSALEYLRAARAQGLDVFRLALKDVLLAVEALADEGDR